MTALGGGGIQTEQERGRRARQRRAGRGAAARRRSARIAQCKQLSCWGGFEGLVGRAARIPAGLWGSRPTAAAGRSRAAADGARPHARMRMHGRVRNGVRAGGRGAGRVRLQVRRRGAAGAAGAGAHARACRARARSRGGGPRRRRGGAARRRGRAARLSAAKECGGLRVIVGPGVPVRTPRGRGMHAGGCWAGAGGGEVGMCQRGGATGDGPGGVARAEGRVSAVGKETKGGSTRNRGLVATQSSDPGESRGGGPAGDAARDRDSARAGPLCGAAPGGRRGPAGPASWVWLQGERRRGGRRRGVWQVDHLQPQVLGGWGRPRGPGGAGRAAPAMGRGPLPGSAGPASRPVRQMCGLGCKRRGRAARSRAASAARGAGTALGGVLRGGQGPRMGRALWGRRGTPAGPWAILIACMRLLSGARAAARPRGQRRRRMASRRPRAAAGERSGGRRGARERRQVRGRLGRRTARAAARGGGPLRGHEGHWPQDAAATRQDNAWRWAPKPSPRRPVVG
jgi:hypothetical protein